jgi:hypothetical protein
MVLKPFFIGSRPAGDDEVRRCETHAVSLTIGSPLESQDSHVKLQIRMEPRGSDARVQCSSPDMQEAPLPSGAISL